MNEIEWAEPPSPKGGGKYEPFAAELRANPGRWAKWPHEYPNPTSLGSVRINIMKGRPSPFKTGKWEAVVRSNALYVRFLGDD